MMNHRLPGQWHRPVIHLHTFVRLHLTAVMDYPICQCIHIWNQGYRLSSVYEMPGRLKPAFNHICARLSVHTVCAAFSCEWPSIRILKTWYETVRRRRNLLYPVKDECMMYTVATELRKVHYTLGQCAYYHTYDGRPSVPRTRWLHALHDNPNTSYAGEWAAICKECNVTY